MQRVGERLRVLRHRHRAAVEIVVRAAGHKRLMGQHEPDGEAERLRLRPIPLAGTDFVQVLDRGGRDRFIVDFVGALPVTGQFQTHALRSRCAIEHTVAYAAAAEVVGAMVADPALGEALQLVRADGMHPPNHGRVIAGGTHRVCKRGRAGAEAVVVGPDLILMGMTPRQHGHAGGDAEWRRAIYVLQHDSLRRQGVEVGSPDEGISSAAHHGRAVLV